MSARRGLSLVEVLIAVIVMGIASSGVAAMTFWVGRKTVVAAGSASRAAVLMEQSDRLAGIAYDSLPAQAGCQPGGEPPFPFSRCVIVTENADQVRNVMLVIAPRNELVRPDTVVFDRLPPTPSTPFH